MRVSPHTAHRDTTEHDPTSTWVVGALAVAAMVALGVSLRLLFGSASSSITEIREGYGLGSVEVALLTTGPVVCLGLGASVAPRLARRFSVLPVTAGAMAVLAAGSALRALPSWPILLISTMFGGLGIAVANVLGPVVIRMLFPHRIGAMTGLLTALICVSAGIASGVTPPLTAALGGSWRLALGAWAVPAGVAALAVSVLAVARGRNRHRASPARTAPRRSRTSAAPPAEPRMRWAITGFMGIQSLLAYATVAWLPTIYRDRGFSADDAGLIFLVLSSCSIITALTVPVLATRMRSQRVLALAVVSASVIGLLGVLGTGTWGAYPCAIILGLGQGGSLSLALVVMNLRSASAVEATALSAWAQTVGYLLAAIGPLAMGFLHAVSHGWSVPLIALTATMVPLAVCGVVAGHPGSAVGGGPDPQHSARAGRPPIHS